MPKNINQKRIIIIVILAIISFLVFALVTKKDNKKIIDVNNVDLETKGINQNDENFKTKQIIIKGTIKGLLTKQDFPETVVFVSDSTESIVRTVTPNFDGNFLINITVPTNTNQLKITIKNPQYVFFPQNKFITLEKDKYEYNIKIDAELSLTKAKNLVITGTITGVTNKDEAVVYLLGSSLITGKEVKKVSKVNRGNFVFDSMDSGTYVIIPYSNNTIFIPKSREIKLKNKDVKTFFVGVKKIY